MDSNFISKTLKVAILREEGSNGEKEMAAAFYQAGFQPIDINMNSLIEEPTLIDKVKGIAFVGGFSFSDVLGAAKGWEMVIKNNQKVFDSMTSFYERNDTFSLGVCNGCQLMARLNWVQNCKFIQNDSKIFESIRRK